MPPRETWRVKIDSRIKEHAVAPHGLFGAISRFFSEVWSALTVCDECGFQQGLSKDCPSCIDYIEDRVSRP